MSKYTKEFKLAVVQDYESLKMCIRDRSDVILHTDSLFEGFKPTLSISRAKNAALRAL